MLSPIISQLLEVSPHQPSPDCGGNAELHFNSPRGEKSTRTKGCCAHSSPNLWMTSVHDGRPESLKVMYKNRPNLLTLVKNVGVKDDPKALAFLVKSFTLSTHLRCYTSMIFNGKYVSYICEYRSHGACSPSVPGFHSPFSQDAAVITLGIRALSETCTATAISPYLVGRKQNLKRLENSEYPNIT